MDAFWVDTPTPKPMQNVFYTKKWWVGLIAIGLRRRLCGAQPHEGLEPSPSIFWSWGSTGYEFPIIHICVLECVWLSQKNKPLATGASPQISTGSLQRSPHLLVIWGGGSLSSNLTLSAPTYRYAQSGRAPQYFPHVGTYGYWDHMTTSGGWGENEGGAHFVASAPGRRKP